MAEPTDMPFGGSGDSNHVLDDVQIRARERETLRWGGVDAAFAKLL